MLTEALRGQCESRSRRTGTPAHVDGPFPDELRNATFEAHPRKDTASENMNAGVLREETQDPQGPIPTNPVGTR